MDQRTAVGWPEVRAVIKASAEKRLGMPLLKAYVALAVVGIVVVVVAVAIMRWG
jgi:hypothetical protein